MRLTLTLPLLAALALPLTGCFDHGDRKKGHGRCNGRDDDPAPASTVGKLGAGTWILMEQAGGVETYRTQGIGGRSPQLYVFSSDGTVQATWPAPACGSLTANGTWSQTGNVVTLNIPRNAPMPTLVNWEIQRLNATELTVKASY